MTATCEIEETPEVMIVRLKFSLWILALWTVGLAIIFGIPLLLVEPPDDRSLLLYPPIFFVLILLLGYFRYPRTTVFQISRNDLSCREAFLICRPSLKTINTSEISYLGYLKPAWRNLPYGIYAEFGDAPKGMIVLRRVDEKQAAEILRRIRGKFPDMAECWRHESSYSTSGTVLLKS